MQQQFYDKKENKVYVLKVPTPQGRQLFVYYRQLTVHDKLTGLNHQKRSMYKELQAEKKKRISKQNKLIRKEKMRPVNTKRTLGDITLKTFSKPKKEEKDEGPKKKTDEESLDNIPIKRTLLLFNFDGEFKVDQVKAWFKTIGRVKRVFVGQHTNRKSNINSKKTLYFALVVFQNLKEMQVCLDHPAIFQDRVHQLLKNLNIIDENEKEQYREKLITSYGTEELSGKKDEFVERMEEDGFTMVVDHLGTYSKFKDTFGKEEEDEEDEREEQKVEEDEEDLEPEVGKKKKTKTYVHSDFYRFQVKNNTAIKTMGIHNFNRFNKDNEDAVSFKVKELKKGFQDDIQKLQELRNLRMKKKPMVQNGAHDDDDE